MSFFYNLNKKLDGIANKAEPQQINERDMGKHNNATTGFKAVADKAAKEYGSKAAGERVAGAVKAKMAKAGKLEEADLDEGLGDVVSNVVDRLTGKPTKAQYAARAARQADNVHGAEGKARRTDALAQVASSDKALGYDESLDEVYAWNPSNQYDHYGDNASPEEHKAWNDESNLYKTPGAHPGLATKGMMRAQAMNSRLAQKLASIDAKNKQQASAAATTSQTMSRAKQGLSGMYEEGNKPMTPKQKSFAKLAPPTDKITFADKIAGAKKEVDEMLGDVAAEAMKSALTGGQKKLDKNQNGKLDAMDFEILRKGAGKKSMDETQGATTYTVAYKDSNNPKKSNSTQVKATSAVEAKAAFEEWNSDNTPGRFVYLGSRPDVDTVYEADRENAFTAHKRPRAETPKVGTVTHGSKHDVEEIPGGRRVTRRTDSAGISVGADDGQSSSSDAPRGRGRPKGPAKAPERVTGGATKHKDGRKVKEGTDQGQPQQIYNELADVRAVAKQAQRGGEFPQGFASRLESVLYAAMTLIKNQQPGNAQVSEEELDEKAVSKKQQKFMGMVHAAQKGEKPASGAVAKVAKEMPKKAAKDFAATKHKGLPEKKKPEAKDKKEESVEDKPSKSSSKFKFGGSVYENLDTQLETLINESMNVSVNMATADNGQDDHSITVTASGEDAMALAQLLKSAGLTQSSHEGCSTCGQSECGCEQMDENSPDWPTNTETSNDALQYAGGLNKPKSTGQTTTPVLASQLRRQVSMEESVKIERNLFDLYKNFTK